MKSKNIKSFLSITGYATIAAIASGIGTTTVIDSIKSHNIQVNNVDRKIHKSIDTTNNISAALLIISVDSSSYKMRLATSGTKNLKILNRYFYEIIDGKSSYIIPEWDSKTQSYNQTVQRTDKEKIVVFAIDVQLADGTIETIVSNDYKIRPTIINSRFKLQANDQKSSKNDVFVNVKIDNYKDLNDLKIIWEKKYDIAGSQLSYDAMEETNFSNEQIFKKEICAKYVKASIVERIIVPVGLFSSGQSKYETIDVKTNLTDTIYIHPGMFSSYKIDNIFIDKNNIKLEAIFHSGNTQKEIEYSIVDWQVKENDEKWKSLGIKTKSIVRDFSIFENKKYRAIYLLKNGSKKDIAGTNIIDFSSMKNVYLEKDNGILKVTNLPNYINEFGIKYSWFQKSGENSEFSPVINNKKELILDNKGESNIFYKVILNYKDILVNFELPVINIKNDLTENTIFLEKESFPNNLIAISASTIFKNANPNNTQYVWGDENGILESKVGAKVIFARQFAPKKYWVFASNGNNFTKRTFFQISEAFSPNFEIENDGNKLKVKITNENIDQSKVNYLWQISNDGNKWKTTDNNENYYQYSKGNSKFARVKLTYKEIGDILISHIIGVNQYL